MESWRKVWRTMAGHLSTDVLQKLAEALIADDPRLIQAATTQPHPLQCTEDWPVELACVIGFCGWQGEGLNTVGEVEEYFAQKCFDVDQELGEPAGCRWFLNWYDETPRDEMRRELLAEVTKTLAEREEQAA